MKHGMTLEEALKWADTFGPLQSDPPDGDAPALMVLAEEVRRLRQQLDAAPVAIMDTRDALGICAPTEEDFPALYALQGHRVALVDLGPNTQISGEVR